MRNIKLHFLSFMKFINCFYKERNNVFVFLFFEEVEEEIDPKIKYKKLSSNVFLVKKDNILHLIDLMYISNKIILHGVYSEYIYYIYISYPKFFDKTYCILLSGDFYFPYEKDFKLKWFLKNVKNVITFLQEEYELAHIWYGTKGRLFLSFVYPSNVFTPIELKESDNKKDKYINVLIGHSAKREYNHMEIINLLEKINNKGNIRVYSPFSYGKEDKTYVNEVIKFGKKFWGNKFIPITKFLPIDEYKKFLNRMDIAIFGQCQSAAMGNIINLLGLGKKVYIRKDTTFWPFFNRMGVKVFDIENITLKKIERKVAAKNKNIIKKVFSMENLIKQWEEIFNS